ncbi:hypothetical protein BC833DRAFT_603295 [Globomyces pollinis-pini]|nr:hypothetical protein BC833DRAFT_603295 [Globomyces pollinis-pini]
MISIHEKSIKSAPVTKKERVPISLRTKIQSANPLKPQTEVVKQKTPVYSSRSRLTNGEPQQSPLIKPRVSKMKSMNDLQTNKVERSVIQRASSTSNIKPPLTRPSISKITRTTSEKSIKSPSTTVTKPTISYRVGSRISLTKNAKQYLNDIPHEITLKKIIDMNLLDQDFQTENEVKTHVSQLQRIRLDRQEIKGLAGCRLFPNVTHLYLQNNLISEIPSVGLQLDQLVFLTLANNQLTSIQGLSSLKSLQLLDLEFNQIEMIDEVDYPKNLEYLILRNNPIATRSGHLYRINIIKHLPELIELDENLVSDLERKLSGHNVDPLIEVDAVDIEPQPIMSKHLDYHDVLQNILSRSKARQVK